MQSLADDSREESDVPASAAIVPVVIVAIVIFASIIAFLLRRKAVAGKMDVEKGNAQIRGSTVFFYCRAKITLSSIYCKNAITFNLFLRNVGNL